MPVQYFRERLNTKQDHILNVLVQLSEQMPGISPKPLREFRKQPMLTTSKPKQLKQPMKRQPKKLLFSPHQKLRQLLLKRMRLRKRMMHKKLKQLTKQLKKKIR